MSNSEKQVDIREYWGVIVRRKAVLILPLIIVPLIALAASYFLAPVYMSSVSIMLGESRILPPSVERQLEGQPSYSRISNLERQRSYQNQITSTKYLRRLIAVLDIPINDQIRQVAAQTKALYPEISENELAETILANGLGKNVVVELSAHDLLQISFEASDPVSAQKRAKALADIFIEESLANELAGIRSNITFSEEQLAFYRDKLKTAEEKLTNFRQQLLVSGVAEDTSGYSLLQIVSAAEALDLEISVQESKLLDLRAKMISDKVDVGKLNIPNELQAAKDQLLKTISKLTDLITKHSWRDPKVLNLNEEARIMLADLNTRIKGDVNRRYADRSESIRDNIAAYLIGQLNLDFNREKRITLDKSIGRIKSQLSKNPDSEITMERLRSEIDNYKTLYDLFVQHSQYAAIDQSAKKVEAEAKYIIIKPASLPLIPEFPNKIKLLLMGFVLGLILGGGVILLLEIIDSSFKKVEDVEEYLKLRVVGTIPKIALPYGSGFKKKIPVLIGAGISFILVLLIIFLNFRKNG